MNPAIDARCYALLDDASAAAPGGGGSRLSTGHLATLSFAEGAGWGTLL
ncbi:hypothetical protein ACFDR9_003969, partial [Janthinobacterium sp. CG_23.3]